MVPSSEGPKVAMISASDSGFKDNGSMDSRKARMHKGRVLANVPSRSKMIPFIFFTVIAGVLPKYYDS